MKAINFDPFSLNPANFEEAALNCFHYQYEQIEVYQEFCNRVKRKPEQVTRIDDIPFLPISFFKTHQVVPSAKAKLLFKSSGTGNQQRSQRFVIQPELYEQSFLQHFTHSFGKPEELCILALLPNYLEQGNSSLVYMVDHLIQKSEHLKSGFYLDNLSELSSSIKTLESNQTPTILFGVSYALLDFAAEHGMKLNHTKIVETGGMKGRRKELTKAELHAQLQQAFGQEQIYSEYGMTELYSQAYSLAQGRFTCPPWMAVKSRQLKDPFSFNGFGKTGGLNIIDLANLDAVSFIETQDLVRTYPDGSFELIGRMDMAELRGCNLMYDGPA